MSSLLPPGYDVPSFLSRIALGSAFPTARRISWNVVHSRSPRALRYEQTIALAVIFFSRKSPRECALGETRVHEI